MTFEEYNKEIDAFEKRLMETNSGEEWNKVIEELNSFQYKYMREFVAEYKKKAEGNPAREVIYDAFNYVVECGTNGSVNEYVDSEDLANEIDEVIWEDIGDFMLEAPEIYKDRYSGQWCISCMFGGAYVPEWDGWEDLLHAFHNTVNVTRR